MGKHLRLTEISVRYKAKGEGMKVEPCQWVLEIDQTLYSYLQQKFNFNSIMLDDLFSETEDNKRKKQEEIDDLYKRICAPVAKQMMEDLK